MSSAISELAGASAIIITEKQLKLMAQMGQTTGIAVDTSEASEQELNP